MLTFKKYRKKAQKNSSPILAKRTKERYIYLSFYAIAYIFSLSNSLYIISLNWD